jgi:hypothetical protein
LEELAVLDEGYAAVGEVGGETGAPILAFGLHLRVTGDVAGFAGVVDQVEDLFAGPWGGTTSSLRRFLARGCACPFEVPGGVAELGQ